MASNIWDMLIYLEGHSENHPRVIQNVCSPEYLHNQFHFEQFFFKLQSECLLKLAIHSRRSFHITQARTRAHLNMRVNAVDRCPEILSTITGLPRLGYEKRDSCGAWAAGLSVCHMPRDWLSPTRSGARARGTPAHRRGNVHGILATVPTAHPE